jgi:hypothetical protein
VASQTATELRGRHSSRMSALPLFDADGRAVAAQVNSKSSAVPGGACHHRGLRERRSRLTATPIPTATSTTPIGPGALACWPTLQGMAPESSSSGDGLASADFALASAEPPSAARAAPPARTQVKSAIEGTRRSQDLMSSKQLQSTCLAGKRVDSLRSTSDDRNERDRGVAVCAGRCRSDGASCGAVA